MTTHQLRELASSRPFVPFRISTRSGRSYLVDRPCSVEVVPRARCVRVVQHGYFTVVDVADIINVEQLGDGLD
jgi:hypothetical protein